MFVQVIPARRMPLALPWLDYSVTAKNEDKIKIGQLVKIPFRNQEIFGVARGVQSGEPEAKSKIKPIKEIVFAKPVLSPAQLNFLTDMAEFYHTSPGFLLKTNLLPLQTRKLKKMAAEKINFVPAQSGFKAGKPRLYIHKDEAAKKEIIVKKLKGEKGQSLILVPELAAIKNITSILPAGILKRAAVVTGELTDKELFAVWLQIWSGEKNIVVGTRAALFLPWFNLKNIILTDEGNANYKSWDMAPRFHTRDATLFLSKHHGAELSLLAHTPSVESYYFAKNKVYLADDLSIKPSGATADIIDMKSERRGGNYSLISMEALEEWKKHSTGSVVFFLNRRGTAGYVGCQDCGHILTCPRCRRALTYHQNKKVLICHYCHRHSGTPPAPHLRRPHGGGHFFELMPAVCKICAGANVATYGAGTQLAEELIKKIAAKIGDARPIIRVDKDENELAKLKTKNDTIIICTQLAWAHLPWNGIELFVFLDADTPLFIPEYKIIENLWQQMRDARYRLPDRSALLIQTRHPEHLTFKSLYNPDLFYSEQLAERRVLGYPPFKYMLKLLVGGQNSATAAKEADKVKTDLSRLTKDVSGIKLTGPLETSPHYYNGQYWQAILAKINYENYKQHTKLLLSRAPESWKVDPNPNSLLYFS